MPDQYDGSVIIDTELDSSGFEKGSDKLKAAMRGFTKALDSMAGNAARAFQEPIKAPEIAAPDDSGMEAAIAEFEEHEREIAEATKQIFEDADSSKLVEEYDDAEAAADRLAQRQKALHELMEEKAADAYAENHAADEKTFDRYARVIERNASAITVALDRIQHASEQGFRNTSQVLNFSSNIDAAEKRIATLKQAMQELGELQLLDETQQGRYENMRAEIERIETDLRTSAGLINQESIEQARLNVLTAQQKVATAETAKERSKAMAELMKAQSNLAMMAQQSVTPAPDTEAVTGWQNFGNIIRNVGETARGTLRSLGTGMLNGIRNGFRVATNGARNLLSNIRRTRTGADGLVKKLMSLKTMLLGRIRSTFITFLFNSIQEAFKELAKFDSRFDKSISNLRNRTKELGTNVMGALGGLIRQIEPIITKVIDAASTAVTKLNAVMTSIRGESIMQVAVRRTESYSDSLRDSAKEAKEAKKAQDKLNATLTTYDEIHKLEGPQDTGADFADTGADAEKAVYENVPVESILGSMDTLGRDIADRIVQGIKSGDWAEAGRAISDGLNAVVAKIDEKLKAARPKAEKAASNLADLLNGMVEEFDGKTIGKTIADGLNLALGTANAFLERFNFYSFGATIGDGITGAVQNIEWETAGRTLGNAINGVIDTAKGIFEHTDWRGAGAGLGRSLNTLFETIEWGKAAQTLSTGIIGIFDSISAFLETVEWKGLGEKVWEFVTNIDWGGIARAVFETAGAALGGLASFLWGIISSAWADLRAWWEENSGDTGDSVIKRLLIGIGNALIGIGDWILTNVWAPFAEGFLKAFGLSDEEASGLMQFGRQAIAGFFDGIAEGLANVIVWVDENIWQPLKKAVKQAFGIHSPSTKMAELGEFVTAGLLAGIRDGLKNIKSWITKKVFDPIVDAIKSAFGITSGAASKLLDIGKNVIDGFLDGVKDGMTNIGNWLETNVTGKFVGKFKDLLGIHSPSTLFKKLGGFLTEGFENGLTAGWEKITGFFTQKVSAFEKRGTEMVESLRSGIQNAWGALQQAFSEGIESLPNAVRLDDFRAAGSNIMDAIRAGFVNARDSLVGDVWRVMGDLQGWFNTDAHSSFYDIGVYLAEGLANGIEAGWYGVDGVCQHLAGGTLNLVRAMFGIASPSKVTAEIGEYLAEGLAIGIDNGERGVLQTAGALARSVTAELATDADLEFSADTMVTGLDLVADKLAAIARTFAAIGRMFPDMTAVPVPAAALGAITPAQTRVFSDDRGSDSETNRLLNKLITRIGELEEQVASRPIRLESKLYVEQREIGHATNDYNASQSRISNGTLGGGSSKW